jgi:hypothetical protein
MTSGWWDDYRERADRITAAVHSRLRRGQVQWKWPFDQLGVNNIPRCPVCGALIGKDKGQVAHENWHGEPDAILDEIGYEGITHVATARIYSEQQEIGEGEPDVEPI